MNRTRDSRILLQPRLLGKSKMTNENDDLESIISKTDNSLSAEHGRSFTIRFHPTVDFYHIAIDKIDICTIWLQDDDYDNMDDENADILKQMMEYESGMDTIKNNSAFDMDRKIFTKLGTSSRGLEHLLPERHERRQTLKQDAWDAVIDEQQRQWKENISDPEAIAKAYRKICLFPEEVAQYRGLMDEKEVQEFQRDSQTSLILDDEDDDIDTGTFETNTTNATAGTAITELTNESEHSNEKPTVAPKAVVDPSIRGRIINSKKSPCPRRKKLSLQNIPTLNQMFEKSKPIEEDDKKLASSNVDKEKLKSMLGKNNEQRLAMDISRHKAAKKKKKKKGKSKKKKNRDPKRMAKNLNDEKVVHRLQATLPNIETSKPPGPESDRIKPTSSRNEKSSSTRGNSERPKSNRRTARNFFFDFCDGIMNGMLDRKKDKLSEDQTLPSVTHSTGRLRGSVSFSNSVNVGEANGNHFTFENQWFTKEQIHRSKSRCVRLAREMEKPNTDDNENLEDDRRGLEHILDLTRTNIVQLAIKAVMDEQDRQKSKYLAIKQPNKLAKISRHSSVSCVEEARKRALYDELVAKDIFKDNSDAKVIPPPPPPITPSPSPSSSPSPQNKSPSSQSKLASSHQPRSPPRSKSPSRSKSPFHSRSPSNRKTKKKISSLPRISNDSKRKLKTSSPQSQRKRPISTLPSPPSAVGKFKNSIRKSGKSFLLKRNSSIRKHKVELSPMERLLLSKRNSSIRKKKLDASALERRRQSQREKKPSSARAILTLIKPNIEFSKSRRRLQRSLSMSQIHSLWKVGKFQISRSSFLLQSK